MEEPLVAQMMQQKMMTPLAQLPLIFGETNLYENLKLCGSKIQKRMVL
jgi:hypothetical protein